MSTATSVTSGAETTFSEHEDSSDDEDEQRVVGDGEYFDYRGGEYALRPDHTQRPIWVCGDNHVFLETHSPAFKQAQDFLIAIAEPVNRPKLVHEYKYTALSLFAAVSIGLETRDIISGLDMLSKTALPATVIEYIKQSTSNFGRLKLVLRQGSFFLETRLDEVFAKICKVVSETCGSDKLETFYDNRKISTSKKKKSKSRLAMLAAVEDGAVEQLDDELGPSKSVRVGHQYIASVKKKLLSIGLPPVNEYDFKNDDATEEMNIDINPDIQIWQHQEKGLSKMFSHGRARSGMIVLPCGAGKTLVGVTASTNIKRTTMVVCNSEVAVEQWAQSFKNFTNIKHSEIMKFRSGGDHLTDPSPRLKKVVICGYHMLTYSGKRAEATEKIMELIRLRQWGLLVLDEVHGFAADKVKTLVHDVHAHCKLGLTATLVREDDKVHDLIHLVGPKLYEASWQDLADAGYLARVQCCEIWCPMTSSFMRGYLNEQSAKQRQRMCRYNPNKFWACAHLVRKHEALGHKIIVFSDDIAALKVYAHFLHRTYVYGKMKHQQRMDALRSFQGLAGSDGVVNEQNTIILSTVGDVAIDLPEANVLIQVASQFGSRRQEAQRLGRILRRKEANADGSPNAWFYTLVSQDTSEVYFSTKRRQFLVDQGYQYDIATELHEPDGSPVFFPLDDPQGIADTMWNAYINPGVYARWDETTTEKRSVSVDKKKGFPEVKKVVSAGHSIIQKRNKRRLG